MISGGTRFSNLWLSPFTPSLPFLFLLPFLFPYLPSLFSSLPFHPHFPLHPFPSSLPSFSLLLSIRFPFLQAIPFSIGVKRPSWRLGSLGSASAPPAGPGRTRPPNVFWYILGLKFTSLVIIILMSFH